MRIALAPDGNQVRANHPAAPLWSWPDPERSGNLAAERGAAEPELVDRSCQCERLESGGGVIFNETKTHDPFPSRGPWCEMIRAGLSQSREVDVAMSGLPTAPANTTGHAAERPDDSILFINDASLR